MERDETRERINFDEKDFQKKGIFDVRDIDRSSENLFDLRTTFPEILVIFNEAFVADRGPGSRSWIVRYFRERV